MSGRGAKARGGVFFLYGDDGFSKEEAVRKLVEAHLDPATADFNLDQLRGSELDVEALASIVATPPMMAPWRVVVVREVESLAGQPRARDLLLTLADRPPPGLTLVLEASVPTGSSANIYRMLKRKASSREYRALSLDDVPGWLIGRAGQGFGVRLEEQAARAMAAAIGTDLGILSRELEKLATLVGEGGSVGVSEVEAAGTSIPRQNRWQWVDLVGARRWEEAIGGLGILLDQGETGVSLTIAITTQLLRLGVVLEKGVAALETMLPRRQKFVATLLAGQAQAWRSEELEAAVLGLLRVDRLLKSSSFSGEHLLHEWLLVEMNRHKEDA